MHRFGLSVSLLCCSSSRPFGGSLKANLKRAFVVSSMASGPATPYKTKPPSSWSLPCKQPAIDQKDEVIAACFPTFPQQLLPHFFSCDWNMWTGTSFFYVPDQWHNVSHAEAMITYGYKVPGQPVRPLAFLHSADIIVLAAAGKEYVMWDGDYQDLTRFGRFSSDEDFLGRVAGLYSYQLRALGVMETFPADYDTNMMRARAKGGGPVAQPPQGSTQDLNLARLASDAPIGLDI
ncbi:hypothetical protein B0H19DRAFT_1070860 [Mycena capillaripes]|nr:hypothetical protein B0H19DRAFT_1070860 [Mycena capillaripes]